MSKNNKPSKPISRYLASQREQQNRLSTIGNTMARMHYSKMADRVQRWLNKSEKEVDARYRLNQYPSWWMLTKMDLLRWLHSKYFDASLDNDSGGLMGALFTLIAGVGYIILAVALYALMFAAVIWAIPQLFDWLFQIE